MSLTTSLESSGNKLFKYRGQIPVIVFVLAAPVLYFNNIYNYPCSLSPDSIFITPLTIIAIIIALLGLLIRAYTIGTTPKGTSGRNTSEQVAFSLNKTGIYSVLRHPLYLGNYLIWLGILIFTFNVWFVIFISLLFWLFYERIMFAEECFLERKFGNDFVDWTMKIPAFIPSFTNYVKTDICFSFKTFLRREYSGVLAIAFAFVYIDLLRFYFINEYLNLRRISVYIFIIILILVLIIRSIKHFTNLLDEHDRS